MVSASTSPMATYACGASVQYEYTYLHAHHMTIRHPMPSITLGILGRLTKYGNGLSQNVDGSSSCVTGTSPAVCHAVTVTTRVLCRLEFDWTLHSHGPGNPLSISNVVYTEQITVSFGRESKNVIDVTT